MMTTHPDTLCYSCKNSCNHGCSWSDSFTPVNGWIAVESNAGYCVFKCPEFVCDIYTDEKGREKTRREMHPDLDPDGVVYMLEAALRRTREDYLLGLGPIRDDDRPRRSKNDFVSNSAENRKLIEREIRSEHFCTMFHVENPEEVIQFLRRELRRKYSGQID